MTSVHSRAPSPFRFSKPAGAKRSEKGHGHENGLQSKGRIKPLSSSGSTVD